MLFIWVVDTRGKSTPLVVDLTSNIALAFGAEPSVLMPTLCALATMENNAIKKMLKRRFFMIIKLKDDGINWRNFIGV